jgi:hypothetical protein
MRMHHKQHNNRQQEVQTGHRHFAGPRQLHFDVGIGIINWARSGRLGGNGDSNTT